MRIIGFNFTKVSAEKSPKFQLGTNINTDIEFTNIEKEETDLAKDGSDVLKVSFKFSVLYRDKDEKNIKDSSKGEISLLGFVVLLASSEESKEILKDWKKKELSNAFKVPIFNFILKKSSVRAMQLEEELNLPLHVPMPQIKSGKLEEKQ